MTQFNYQKTSFLLSVAALSQLPADSGKEVAIVGRSNSGKSSVLNQLTRNKSLARVSKTPGRTQHINLFEVEKNRRIADLPGYGFAKVPPKMKHHWEKILDAYLRTRDCLQGLILVMDIRHPLKEFDQLLLDWCEAADLPVHMLLNKADKLASGATKKTLFEVEAFVADYQNTITFQAFSALRGVGAKALRDQLDQWLE